MQRLPVALLLIALALAPMTPAAQADTVVLQDGKALEGVTLEEDDEEVRLLLPDGEERRIARADVAKVERDGKAPTGKTLLRYEEADGEGRLDVAVVHYLHPGGRRVDLIGMLHVADEAYYHQVQALCDRVEVVLYEGVKPKDATMEERAKEIREEGIGRIQVKLAEWLELTFQLDGIDYGREHFVHADLTRAELTERLGGAGDVPIEDALAEVRGVAVIWRIVEPVMDLLSKLADRFPRMRWSIKRAVAKALALAGGDVERHLPRETYELIVLERNAVVLARMNELAAKVGTVAVIYGAAHLPDLEQRLANAGYRRAGARWLRAWTFAEP